VEAAAKTSDVPSVPEDHKLRQFFDLSLDMLCTASIEGYFTTLNDSWGRTLGYSDAELKERPFLDFVHPDDRERTEAEAGRIMEGRNAVDFENRYIGKRGDVHWLQWSAVFSPADQLIYARATDITERRRLEQELESKAAELEQSNAELDQFASVVSHDLNSPMTTIAGYAQLLHERYDGTIGDPGRDWIASVLRGIERSQSLIDDLLAFSRAGRAEIELRPVDMAALTEGVVADLQSAMDERRVDLRVDALPTVQGDPAQLRRLMQNLVSNAVKFSDAENPVVEISGEQNGNGWRFKVTDNGIGIPPEQRKEAFEPFKRLPGGSEKPGNGIGLAICARIVERHGGEIHIEDGIDGGSSFVFTIGEQ
jgi:PAS domain S-box-containing protein